MCNTNAVWSRVLVAMYHYIQLESQLGRVPGVFPAQNMSGPSAAHSSHILKVFRYS